MNEYVLSYYPEFKCVAGECKHTCCAGWEMNIDKATLDEYKKHNSHFSGKLFSGINFKKSKFETDKSGRCAFLNDKGLCEIIINLGEQSLCQVCRDHPRFRSYFDDRVETGLGFCCEQATKIILSYKNKIDMVLVNEVEKDSEPSFIEKQILNFRKQTLDIIQDRNIDINERIENILSLCSAKIDDASFNKVIRRLRAFERLDKGWQVRLKNLKNNGAKLTTNKDCALYCEQFLVNSFYRHISTAEDAIAARSRALACVFSWWIINGIFETEKCCQALLACICDVVRAYSAEIEYSQKNLYLLYAIASKFVKL